MTGTIDAPAAPPYRAAVAKKPAKSKPPAADAPDLIRGIIMAEVERRGLNGYQLAKLVTPHVSRATVYNFMAGDTITTETASHFIRALEIKLPAPPKK